MVFCLRPLQSVLCTSSREKQILHFRSPSVSLREKRGGGDVMGNSRFRMLGSAGEGVPCSPARAESWRIERVPFHLDIAGFVIYYSAKRG